jgi:hypothetical protein
MFSLIMYALVIAALVGGAFAVKGSIEDKGAAKMRATWAPLIEKCESAKRKAADCTNEWTDAVAKNGTLNLALGQVTAQANQCSASVKQAAADGVAIEQAKQTNLAKSLTLVASAQAEAAKQRALAAAPQKTGVTCEQTLRAVDASLDELAARQLRFNPDGPVGGGAEGAAAGAGGSDSTVRIRH